MDPSESMDQILADGGEFCDEEQLIKGKSALVWVVEIAMIFDVPILGQKFDVPPTKIWKSLPQVLTQVLTQDFGAVLRVSSWAESWGRKIAKAASLLPPGRSRWGAQR